MTEPRIRTVLRSTPVLAIVRASAADRVPEVAAVLADAGIVALEVALTTPGALPAIEQVAARHPEVCVGAGTVLTAGQLASAVDAGAAYVVTPGLVPEVMDAARDREVAVLCGALTPTEILAARAAGASMVKIFPASLGGPAYIAAVRAPLPDVDLLPTGGVGLDDVAAYLAAGAAAVAAGSPLVGDACAPGGDLGALAERARGFVAAAAGGRA